MGNPLGHLMANIFVGFHERLLFDNIPKPCCYFYYFDDTFEYFSSHNETDRIYNIKNNPLLSLQSRMEVEYNNMLPFMFLSSPAYI